GEAARRINVEMERFLTDVWQSGGWEETEPDRMLATVLFTDIVDSTAKAIALGDRAWRELLEQHHAIVRRELMRFRGRDVDAAGEPGRVAPLRGGAGRRLTYAAVVERAVTVACVQAEPIVLVREGTLTRLGELAAEAAGKGAELVVFPETFVPVYPSSRWAKAFARWEADGAKETFARLAQESVAVGSPAERRIGGAAQELGIWIVTGVNEVEPERPGTIYNSLLYHSPTGELALHHRKLVPTNHERLVWGQGDGRGLEAVETGFGRVGGLICWENYMPLARVAL